MNNNIRRFGGTIEGAFVVQRGQQRRGRGTEAPAGEGADINAAVLVQNPKTLMELWREYKFGIEGRKPAEQFTTAERNNRVGGINQKYYRRNVVWAVHG